MQPQDDDQFLTAMGLDSLQGEAKDKALEDILLTLNMRVVSRVLDSLGEDQQKQFEELSSKEDLSNEELSAWIQQNVPNFGDIVNEEAEKMKQENQDILKEVMGES